MNGNRYLLDTNAIVALLQGNSQLIQLLQDADWIGVSVISQIEFLAFSGLSEADRQLFQQFLQRVEIVGLVGGNGARRVTMQITIDIPDESDTVFAANWRSANDCSTQGY
jgi:predicted nucleic acid-binding protein